MGCFNCQWSASGQAGSCQREVSNNIRPPSLSDWAAAIHADPALMKLLVQNLVDNAVKFSRPDSRPVVTQLEDTEDHVVLRVADDGIGIPAGSEERLFEPFFKLNRARGHRAGYGIGLNLCRRIVELHDGTIRLLPREPRGTEAVVTLRRRPLSCSPSQ